MSRIHLHPDVAAALHMGRPIVALETAVVTSGLPRRPVDDLSVDCDGWRSDRPVNLEAALMMDRAVRSNGAAPAMVAVIDGKLRIGLDERDMERLAMDEAASKASISNLAVLCAAGATAGTAVSATLHACSQFGIRTFATGGIGGVHRGASPLDVSADLLQLAQCPVLTVCAGAKSMLDLPATLEALETLGVPVLGWRTAQFAQFYSAGTEQLKVTTTVESASEVAAICDAHWRGLHLQSGLILANPVPQNHAMEAGEIEQLVEQAEHAAQRSGASGSARTPFVLEEMARLSGGRTLRANIALLESNAALAAQVAIELAR